jgi:DNA-binding response OmpR family regulator
MKAVIIGSDAVTVNFATLAMRLRWPDTIPSVAPNGAEAPRLIEKEAPEVVLLHANHAGMGLSECVREIRQVTMAPLLVLGSHGKEIEVVTALTLGADDYVKLPCNITELTVRVWATFRRTGMETGSLQASPLRSGSLLLNLSTREVFLRDQALRLTPTEFRLLRKLVENRGSVVPHQSLEQSIGDGECDAQGLVKKYIQRLRSKLGDDARAPRWIACIHGVGYRFVGPIPSSSHNYQPSPEPVHATLSGVGV